jgi:hypothetical protein
VKFHPRPENDFLGFVHDYFQRCQRRVPQLRAVAAKWRFEDLIPGLSDVDLRFILAAPMGASDWTHMSLEVGQVHAEMCRENAAWARTLEHLPGINLTVDEITEPALFYPEFAQWTFYEGDAESIEAVRGALSRVAWSARDERHHLKRFATFFGPYRRGIDPPVNLGPWENKYALHSRCMHYFAPPVQSAVSIHLRRNVPGKLEALRQARTMFPNPQVIDQVLESTQRHYEIAEDYAEPRLTEIERRLEDYLRDLWRSLAGRATLVAPAPGDDVQTVRAKIAAVPADPTAEFFEGAKFGRLLEGRLRFYAEQIPWFDSVWLIRNELQRMLQNFYIKPLTMYGRLSDGQALSPELMLERLAGSTLDERTCAGVREFVRIVGEPVPAGGERDRARAVADAYRPVMVMLETLGADVLMRVKCRGENVVTV